MTAGPYSIGSDHWPGLSKLIEECGELIQVAGKILGTGGSVEHWDGQGDLDKRLADEMGDVLAAIQFVRACNRVPRCDEHADEKYRLFCKWREQEQAAYPLRFLVYQVMSAPPDLRRTTARALGLEGIPAGDVEGDQVILKWAIESGMLSDLAVRLREQGERD